MIRFETPVALWLLPLAFLCLRHRLWPRPLLAVLRVGILVALVALLADPVLDAARGGRDVVVVFDRSRSMPAGQLQTAREFARELAVDLGDEDRIAVVAFDAEAQVVQPLSATLRWPEPASAQPRPADGSDLAGAIATALRLAEPGRELSLWIWSDGEVPWAEAEAMARRAARQRVRLDVAPVLREFGRDAAVHELEVAAELAAEAPFVVHATVVASVAATARYTLSVDGDEVQTGEVELAVGANPLQLSCRLDEPGEHMLALGVAIDGDVAPANDRAQVAVRAVAPLRVLCLTPAGREDRLTTALRAAGIPLDVRPPESAPLSLGGLDAFRCVVLENVPAAALPRRSAAVLAHWVRELGGGLLMTGGADSFGVGGYYGTPIEEVLPVSMELREQQRKYGVAMAIVLDCSGSMSAEAGSATKMQLANSGAASAISLLSSIDAVTVFAVDTTAHQHLPLTDVTDAESLAAVVHGIEVGGGGIYLEPALHAAADALRTATQTNRHVLLFADADDAKQPGDYRELLPRLVADGHTVSVIGMGTEHGRDSALLAEIAQLGGGLLHLVGDANELPRVFAQEAIRATRAAMVDEPTGVVVQPGLRSLGAMPTALPGLGGYSVAWRRPRAELDLLPMQREDGEEVPLLAHWQVGLGRAVAFLGEADGPRSGDWAEWAGYQDFFAALVRWCVGQAPADVYVEARRDGDVGVYRLEVEPERAALVQRLTARYSDPDGGSAALRFESVGRGRLEARLKLDQLGVYRAAVQVDDASLRLPPLCLPYSSEWQLHPDPRHGARLLRYLADRTGGEVSPSPSQIASRAPEPRPAGPRALRGLLVVALVLLVVEVLVRRLGWMLPAMAWTRRRSSQPVSRAGPSVADDARAAREADAGDVAASERDDTFAALRRARRRRRD